MAVLDRLNGYLSGDGYQARAVRGTLLTILNFGGQNFLRLASNLILTRLLFPEAFGLMALVGVVLTGVTMFSDLGLHHSIIQDKRGEERAFLDTAWTFQIIRGVGLAIAVMLLAHPLAAFYEEPLLADMLMVSALLPLIKSLHSTNFALANRKLYLGLITVLMLGSKFVSIVAMVALAWWLQSVWALVIGPLVGSALLVVLTHTVMPGERNRIRFEIDAARRLISFGKYIFLSTVATFFVQQGDKAILGKFVDLDELGFFRIAFFFASVPLALSHAMQARVIYPLYARRPPAEKPEYKRKIDTARLALTGGLVAVAAFLGFTGDWLVRLLYDARYYEAGPILVLIAVFSLPNLIMVSYFRLPLASGRSGRYAIFTVTQAVLQTLLLLVTVPSYGVAAAAMVPGITMALTYPLLVWIIWPFKGWDPRHDIVFWALSILTGVAVFWLKWPILAPFFTTG